MAVSRILLTFFPSFFIFPFCAMYVVDGGSLPWVGGRGVRAAERGLYQAISMYPSGKPICLLSLTHALGMLPHLFM